MRRLRHRDVEQQIPFGLQVAAWDHGCESTVGVHGKLLEGACRLVGVPEVQDRRMWQPIRSPSDGSVDPVRRAMCGAVPPIAPSAAALREGRYRPLHAAPLGKQVCRLRCGRPTSLQGVQCRRRVQADSLATVHSGRDSGLH
ncbi:MAG: hypothetical protein R2856_23245 [Caldilineaceae bacterium]